MRVNHCAVITDKPEKRMSDIKENRDDLKKESVTAVVSESGRHFVCVTPEQALDTLAEVVVDEVDDKRARQEACMPGGVKIKVFDD